MSTLTIEEASTVDRELVDAFARLIPQLSTAPPPSAADLNEIVASAGSHVLVARQAGAIVGTLTLIVFRVPTGVRAWIEDVVVDQAARGAGIGEALTRAALARAAQAGARTVGLTSRASREAANRLYLRLGFTIRDTNLYRHEL
jgi:ribosomal protein S18 acetylase RimI-like enzyme